MLFIGPISSVFDFLTFYVLFGYFHAGEALFHTGWFVESLATQTLVLFVIRTMGNPLRSRPSRALTVAALLIVAIGATLPVTPLAGVLGFTALPLSYLVFLLVATATYLGLVELAKRRLVVRLDRESHLSATAPLNTRPFVHFLIDTAARRTVYLCNLLYIERDGTWTSIRHSGKGRS